jgi:hypothetical protein
VILQEEVDVNINNSNYNYYKEKGYNVERFKKILIKVVDLSTGSHSIIKVKCDNCGKEKEMIYREYIRSFNNCNYYACCEKCAWNKNRNTCNIKYGIDSFSKTNEFKEKFEKTCLEKFNAKSPLESDVIKEKIKQTLINLYGVDHNTKSKEIIKNRKQNTLKIMVLNIQLN